MDKTLDELICECGDNFDSLKKLPKEFVDLHPDDKWVAHATMPESNQSTFGTTPFEAVENLLKVLQAKQ